MFARKVQPRAAGVHPRKVGFRRIPTKVGGAFGLQHGIIRSMVDAALVPLVLILAVAAGLVTATVSASWVHSRQTAFHRWFLANILLFNLLILLGLNQIGLRIDERSRQAERHDDSSKK